MNNPHTLTPSQQANWRQTLAYYTVHISIAAAIAFLVTGSGWIALAVSLIEPVVQLLAWFTLRWERHAQNRKDSRTNSHAHQHTQRHTIEHYLARYARAA